MIVRSERRGREDGRFYLIAVKPDDLKGGVATGVCVAAVVPHDQNPLSLQDVFDQASGALSEVEPVVETLMANDPGHPLPEAIRDLYYEHGLSEELGPKQ